MTSVQNDMHLLDYNGAGAGTRLRTIIWGGGSINFMHDANN